MNILHVFSGEDGKFSIAFSDFLLKNFDSTHEILVFNKNVIHNNVIVLNKNIFGLISVIQKMYKAKKIFIHNLSMSVTVILFFNPWLLKKSYWCIWGGDLYYHTLRKKNIKTNINELFRKYIIRNMHGLITQLKGDYELAKRWYGAKGNYYYSFMYPSNLYKEYDLKKVKKELGKKYIQVGNSACETNSHIEVFEKLSKYKNQNIEIICPLSYSGKEEYIKKVIEVGYKIFGKEKFTPITNFMSFDKYLELLAKVDVAIFNHKRQRGLGNIMTLLGLGKKVYIREEITTWQFCIDHDLKVYNANGNYDDLFEEMDEHIKQKNVENVKTKFSEEKLVEDLKKIFDEEIS